MARGRIISTSVAGDAALNRLSTNATLLYLQTLPHLDRDGLVTGHPILLWALAAPLRTELMDCALSLIDEWVQQGLVIRYDGADGPVLFFKGFRRHQANMPYAKEAPSRFPPPPGWYRTDAGMVPESPDLCRSIAEGFDPRSSYRKALETASRASRNEVATYSGAGRAEDQDQVKDQDQVEVKDEDEWKNDDDVDVTPSSLMSMLSENRSVHDPSARRSASLMAAWCVAVIAEWLPTWSGGDGFVDRLSDDQVTALATWLWHARHHAFADAFDEYDFDGANAALRFIKRNGDPFANVENPVGKIITQTRAGNLASLREGDQREMVDSLLLWASPDAILFEDERRIDD